MVSKPSMGVRPGAKRAPRRQGAGCLLASIAAILLLWPGAAVAAKSGPGAALLPSVTPAAPPGARGESAFDGEEDRVSATLIADASAVRPGESFRVGVLFDLDPGWHIYWRSPGDAGIATQLEWDVAGARIGDPRWPTPHAFAEPDGVDGFITTFGYADRVLLFADAQVDEDAHDLLRLNVKVRFLACEIGCIPGTVELVRDLPVRDRSAAAGSAERALFAAAAEQVPRPLADHGFEVRALYSQSAVRPGDTFEAALVVGCAGRRDCTRPESGEEALGYAFVPDPVPGIELDVVGTLPHPLSAGDYLITLRGEAFEDDPGGDQRLRGIVSLRLAEGTRDARVASAEIDVALPRAPAGAEVAAIGTPWLEAGPAAAGAGSPVPGPVHLGRALLFAFVGGLILNLMPCVLPVLAIKVFAVTEMAHRGRSEVAAHGTAYGAGVILSMLALAAAVIALRAGGESIGWGFQFQEPIFVAAISAVLVVFAMNLFGVFEIFAPTGGLAGIGAQATGARRSFFEGLLAVVLATPCSAPFLGTAVGFAFAASPLVICAIFAAIGAGLASPFVVVTLVPGWARFVPHAGAWMLTLRAGLGFAVLATVVWLLWVVGRLVGTEGIAALLALLVALAFAAWVYGVLQKGGRTIGARTVALVATAAGIAGLVSLPLEAEVEHSSASAEAEVAGSVRTYSPEALAATLDAGQPAFVYFTADWCITCKVNERSTLADAAVQAELERLDFSVFKADWTQRDEAIRAELARFGKAGVPLYLVYGPEAPGSPALLPELLTPGILIEALRKAPGSDS